MGPQSSYRHCPGVSYQAVAVFVALREDEAFAAEAEKRVAGPVGLAAVGLAVEAEPVGFVPVVSALKIGHSFGLLESLLLSNLSRCINPRKWSTIQKEIPEEYRLPLRELGVPSDLYNLLC